jgi:hypothetical protein
MMPADPQFARSYDNQERGAEPELPPAVVTALPRCGLFATPLKY